MSRYHYSLIILLIIPGIVPGAEHLSIVKPWVAEAPAIVKNHAGYMTIVNRGDTTVHINRISSPQYDRIAIHRSVESNGMTRMEHVEQLQVPPGKTLLRPGDFHLMLYNAGQALIAGDNVTMTIAFSDGSELEISAPVMKISDNQ